MIASKSYFLVFAQGTVKIPESEMKVFYERLGSSTPVDGDNYKWYN